MRNRVNPTPLGRKTLIGEGDRARVFYYLDKPYTGNVGRVPKGSEHFYPPNTFKEQFLRFRRHQLARLVFPAWNLAITGFISESNEILSRHVIRSKANLRMATSRRAVARSKGMKYPQDAIEPLAAMQKAGFSVQTGVQNVSVVKGKPTFFAIEGLDISRLKKYIHSQAPQISPQRLKRILAAIEEYEKDIQLDDIDLDEKNKNDFY